MTDTYDIAVIGLGVLGSAAAYHASLRGVKVLGLEQFEFGHVRGASHDTSRIFRTSNPLPEQVHLAKIAYNDWRTLEKHAGQDLLTVTGGFVFIPKGSYYDRKEATDGLEANDVPYELISGEEVNRRFPQFNLPANVEAIWTPDTGVVHASKTVTAMQFVARAKGAILKEKSPVNRITPNGDTVLIDTPGTQYKAKKIILATDAWTNKLLAPLGSEIPLQVMQEQVTYFKPEDISGFEPDKFPVWVWIGDQNFYGFPAYGEPTIKIARDHSENFMDPDKRTFVPSPELLKQLQDFTGAVIPKRGETLRTVTCQYTIPPDRQIVMGPVEGHKNIVVGLGAALGFKYAPGIGRCLVQLALDGKSEAQDAKFAIPKAPVTSKL